MVKAKQFVLDIIGDSPRAREFFFSTLIFLVLFCVLMVYHVWNQNVQQMEEDALRLANVAEAGLVDSNIAELSANPKDLGKQEYRDVKNSLTKIVKVHEKIRFAYLYTVRDDKVYFMADSEPPASSEYSPPGQEYTEAMPQFKDVFYNSEAAVFKTEDRWGKWISVLIPVRNYRTGQPIAVFGVDYEQKIWNKIILAQGMQAVIISICLILVYLFILVIVRRSVILKKEQKKLAKANQKLSEKEELFRTVFEQSPMGIAISSSTGFIDHNSMYEKIVGRTRDEIQAMGWERFTHPEDLVSEMEHYKKFRSQEHESYQMNKRYIKPDGSIVWVNITLAPIKVNGKSELDHICIVEDITERIKAENDLRESERSHSVLLSNLPGMAYRCDYDRFWTMEFVSDGCYELTGYKPNSLIKNAEVSFNELIGANYRDVLWEAWKEAIKKGQKFFGEYEITTASGKIKWVFEQGQAIYDEVGNVIALEGLIIDISDRKKKEDEIKYLNDHDFMTGIYNRRYFENIKTKLDVESSLPLSVIVGDINGVKLVNDALGHGQGDILIKETAKMLQACCRGEDILARTGGDEFEILLPATDFEVATQVVNQIKKACKRYNKNLVNEAHSINISLGLATKTKKEEELEQIIKTAEDHMYKRKLLEHKSSHSIILASIKATMHEKSHETQEHADRLNKLSREVGKKLKLEQQELDELELVATLHDIGKVGIDDRILNKEGKLTEDEWVEMKKHSEIGYRIAMSSPDLVAVADYILSLHERWDGKGYPQGIKGNDIPLLSRIVSVVDAYDAMTEDRPYRRAMSSEEAGMELEKNAGTQFDKQIVRIFMDEVIPEIKKKEYSAN